MPRGAKSIYLSLVIHTRQLLRGVAKDDAGLAMSDTTIFARVNPKELLVKEEYAYRQVVSENPSVQTMAQPKGQVSLVVPYDREEYFTQCAIDDVERQTQRSGFRGLQRREKRKPVDIPEVQIGHLVFAHFGRTNLATMTDPNETFAILPLGLPLTPSRPLEEQCDDCSVYKAGLDYLPEAPPVIPISVNIKILEEEPEAGDDVLLRAIGNNSDSTVSEGLNREADKVLRNVTLSPRLHIRLQVVLNVPSELSVTPVLELLALDWPTLTSLDGIHLHVLSGAPEGASPVPWHYNPLRRRLEWRDVGFAVATGSNGSTVKQYASSELHLHIEHPGELFDQPELEGEVRVRLPERLLSEVEVRRFDAVGHLAAEQPTLSTTLVNHFELVVDEAFAQRTRSPSTQMHFEAVMPSQERVSDVKDVLKTLLFDIRLSQEVSSRPKHTRTVIIAEQQNGPNTMRLVIVLDGTFHKIRRTVVVDGMKLDKVEPSGKLAIYMRGSIDGESRPLLKVMNDFQYSIRKRLETIRSFRPMSAS